MSGVVAASVLLVLGGIIAMGEYRHLYDWSVAYILFVASTSIASAIGAWRLASHFRQIEHEREQHFTLGLDLQTIADFSGHFLRVNPAFTNVLGWSSRELLSRPFMEFVHPDDRPATEAELQKLRSGATVFEFDNRYQCKDGTWRVLSWRAAPSLEHQRIYATARDVTAIKEADRRLRESEENLLITLRSIGDGFVATDAEARITRLNPVGEQLTGWTESEALGKPVSDVLKLVNQYTHNPLAVPVDEVLRTGEPQGLTSHAVLIARDGTEHPVADSASPIRDSGGKVIGCVMVFRDVSGDRAVESAMRRINEDLDRRVRQRTSELERVNAQLEQSRSRLEMAQRVARLGSWELDLLTERLTWSDELFRLTGFAAERGAPTFQEFLDFLHPEDRKLQLEANLRASESASTTRVELRSNPSHGPVRHFHSMVAPVLGRGRRVIKITGTLQDVSEKKLAESALADATERLEMAVRAGNVGMWDWNLQTNDVYYSAEYKRQLGYAEYELDARYDQFDDLLHPEDHDRVIEFLNEYVTHSKTRYVQEFRLRHKDGSYRWILSQGSLATDRDGARHMLGTHVDITEQKRLEEQFFQAQKMESVGRLAGGVAHDFNNLLSVINGYSDLAMQALDEDSPIREDIAEVRKAGSRAAELTRQLLAFSRKQVLQPTVLELGAQLADIEKLLGRLIGEDIDLRIESDPDLGRVKMDPGQFEQVVINLAVNARDAMPRGGVLTIRLRNAGKDAIPGASDTHGDRFVELTVSDNGAGMSPDVLEQIYEPFFTTKHDGRGTGLGLATVYGIVKQSNGHIHVSSEAGRGTVFHVYFPVVDQAAKKPKSRRAASTARGRERILLVEDDENLRRLAERVLLNAGYTVLTAQNAAEAVDLLSNQNELPELLLTDIVMPGESGAHLATRLQDIHPNLKLLFMSGYAGEALSQYDDVLDRGHFIQKPFNAAQLTEKVREALDYVDTTTPVEW